MADLDLPEPKLLQLFDLLYQVRSVTRSAELLGQSQPTVSIWLGRLRTMLRDPLFVRTPAGMAPTPRAEQLIGPCREALEALRRFTSWENAFDPATAERRISICISDASHITLLPQLLARLRSSAPGVQLTAASIDHNTERLLEGGEAALAIGYAPWLGGSVYQQKLYDQDWVCLTSSQRPTGKGALAREQYEAAAHVAIAAGTGAKLLDLALARAGLDRRVVLELPGFLGLGAIIRQSDLVATLPRHIAETLARAGGLAVHDCPFAIDGFSVHQHWHARYHHEPANRWLRSVVWALFGQGRIGESTLDAQL